MKLEIFPIRGIGEISEGDNLAEIILSALTTQEPPQNPEQRALLENDVVIITQKIVSKAEGAVLKVHDKDPNARLEIAAQQSKRILRRRGDLIISETPHGFICANAGVDFSNIEEGMACLLPEDPDLSARKILNQLIQKEALKNPDIENLAVIITDTFGRPWRRGLTNVAIGSAGILPIIDLRGGTDAYGNELHATEMAIVDELAGASEMVMGKSLGIPAAIIRGVPKEWFGEGSVQEDLLRSPEEDLFR